MDSLRKTLKSHGSHKYSSSRNLDHQLEEKPILFDDEDGGDGRTRDVVVKIDDNSTPGVNSKTNSNGNGGASNQPIWREGSYEFWKEDSGAFSFQKPQEMAAIGEDPPAKLISSFLHKQKASGAEVALDMDLELAEIKRQGNSNSNSNSKDLRVSFQEPPRSSDSDDSSDSNDGSRRGLPPRPAPAPGRRSGGVGGGGTGEVLRCTSNASFARAPSLLRAKTRSRLMDPAPVPPASAADDGERKPPKNSSRSTQLKSGFLGGKASVFGDDDDEDPFLDVDVPDELKRPNINIYTILQWLSLLIITAALVCSLVIPPLRRITLWSLHLWKWELMVFMLICGRLVSGWVIRIAVFLIERNFTLRKRVLYFVYGVRKAVQNCLWLGLVLVAWHFLFDKKVERETRSPTLLYVTKVLFCLLVACVLRLVKTLLLKVLASSFHVSTYFDRIQDALFNQYVIETLSGPPLVEIQQIREEEDRMMAEVQKLQNAGATITSDLRAAALPSKSGRAIGSFGSSGRGSMRKSAQIGKSLKLSGAVSRKDAGGPQEEGITIDQLHKLNQKNISAWNMKRLMRIVRYGTLRTLDEQIPQGTEEDESTMQIRSEYEAKTAAKKIFNNVAKPGAKHIYFSDLLRFMRDDEAKKTMSLFEGAQEHNRVSRKSLKNWVVNAFRERRALSLTLNDTKTAVNKLHQMANIVVGIIVCALWLLILGLATTHFFVFISSQFLLLVFIFGNTLKTVFESMIFLFVMHPFDVGDRCEVEGVQMIVEEMNIMTTIFLRYDNLKIHYPNSVLATQPISNYYRSPDMGESIDFCVHVATPVEKLALMKERITGFMENKKEHWYPGSQVVLRDVDDMNRLKVSIWMRHRINFQDMGVRWERRELVVQEMIRILRELDVEYRMLPVDVNVRNMASITSSRLPSTWTTFNKCD